MTTRSRSSVKLVAEIQRPEVSARMFRHRGKQSVTSGARARERADILESSGSPAAGREGCGEEGGA